MTALSNMSVLDDVRALTAQIRAECADIDKTRTIPLPIIHALRDLGTFRLLGPTQVGGACVDPITFLRVVEETSYADGSVGWCVMLGGSYATFGGLMPHEGAHEIYGDPNTISAGAFRPAGRARRVPGGFVVSGHWQLGSGSSHANWFLGGCTLTDGEAPILMKSGAPAVREVFFPAPEVQIVDTWESTGLRGTASHDYTVSEVFVPEHRTFWFTEAPCVDHPLYWMPVVGTFATYLAAVPLGIARHALDEFKRLAGTKTPSWSSTPLAEKPAVQTRFGRAHSLVTGGWSCVLGTLRELWEKVQAGDRPSLSDHGALWVAATHAAQGALEAVELLYAAAGASSVYATCALDRCLRDARTAVQHVTVQEGNFEHHGRELLVPGAAPGPWIMDYRGELVVQ